mmetsp:Transcript_17736/g.25028  ORF Transcript_17736/g.25028 Transcript_17736/m.25028 type:complete len:220 (-) Transcript_17736:59-718(-)
MRSVGLFFTFFIFAVDGFSYQLPPLRNNDGCLIRKTGFFDHSIPLSSCTINSSLRMAGFFGDLDRFFGRNPDDDEDSGDDTDDEEDNFGTARIFNIPVKSMKIGGARLYLSLYFMGEQNNPRKGSWKASQNEEGGIDMFFHDRSAAIILTFSDDAVTVDRLGSAPSMDYLMAEAEVLNNLLDQLDEIAGDETISERDRLICLKEPGNAIELARESLPFT